jgi:O-antigen ligase
MLDQNLRKSIGLKNSLFQIIVAAFLGLLLGIACVRFSGLLILGIIGAVLFLYAILKRPELALLGILLATSSIVFEDQLPMLSAGGISLHIPDLLLLGSLGLIVIRWLVEPKFKIVRTPLDWPLLIFYGLTLASTFIAISHSSTEIEPARRAIRVLSYYLTFFTVTHLVRERRQLNFLLNSFFLLASFVAAIMVAQYVLGSTVTLLPGRVESLNTQGVAYNEITRILPPGISIVLIAFVTTFCILVVEKFKPFSWLNFLQLGLLGLAFLFTFLRSYFGALAIAFFLLVLFLRGYNWQKVVMWSMTAIIPLSMFLLFISSIPDSRVAKLSGASFDRFSTLFESETYQGQDSSLNWRAIENEYALRQIIAHPLLGLGLGSLYRSFDSRLDQPGESDFRGFIHNGYFRILLDSGLLGFLTFMGLSLAFLIRGFQNWRSVANDRMKGVVLGFTLTYLVVLIAAVVNSTFMQWSWTPVFGIIAGINEVILMKFRQTEPIR